MQLKHILESGNIQDSYRKVEAELKQLVATCKAENLSFKLEPIASGNIWENIRTTERNIATLKKLLGKN